MLRGLAGSCVAKVHILADSTKHFGRNLLLRLNFKENCYLSTLYQAPTQISEQQALAELPQTTAGFMKQYRRHAVIVIAVIAAVITPPDLFTCCMVIVPMYGLYELNILIVGMTNRK